MDPREFYARVDALIDDLRVSGYASKADQVETAIRGGATSGEILERLGVALPVESGSVTGLAHEVDELAKWLRSTLQRGAGGHDPIDRTAASTRSADPAT